MSKNSTSNIIGIVIGAAILMFLGWLITRKPGDNWQVTLLETKTEPYDIHVFVNALKSHSNLKVNSPNRPPNIEEYEFLEKKTFVILDRYLSLSSKRMEDLETLCDMGHNVYLISGNLDLDESPTIKLQDNITKSFEYDSLKLSNQTGQFFAPTLKHWNRGWTNYYAHYFKKKFILDNEAKVQLNANGNPIWVSINKNSEGSMHFLSLPLIYSNFYLKQDSSLEVLEHFVNSIETAEVLLYPQATEKFKARVFGSSKLSFIKDNFALRMAAITLIIFLGLFLFFAGKRRQQSRPIAKEEESSFVLTSKFIGPYYNTKNRIQNLEKKLIYQFDSLIYASYGINLQNCSEEELSFVAHKLNVEESDITEIQYALKIIRDIPKKDFLILHNKITKILNQWKK